MFSQLCCSRCTQDRHNGNILCDKHGHVIHIDFGFMLSTSPGELGFEVAPFKLSQEFLDVMRADEETGTGPDTFEYFERLCIHGFKAVRQHHHRIALLLQNAKDGQSGSVNDLAYLTSVFAFQGLNCHASQEA